MNRKMIVAAVSAAGLLALGACARGDDTAYDTAAGATAGALATPPATFPGDIGMTTGATTTVPDTLARDTTIRNP